MRLTRQINKFTLYSGEESAEDIDDEQESDTETGKTEIVVKSGVIVEPEKGELNPGLLMPRTVVENPKVFLVVFLDHYSKEEHLPDLSEGRPLSKEELMYWKNLKCVAMLMPHKDLEGLCGKWTHIAIDFTMAHNNWCVIFTKNGMVYDMTTRFILHMWVCYAAQMNGRPSLESKACRKVRSLGCFRGLH